MSEDTPPRWRLMLATLSGDPPPPLPEVVGHVHLAEDDTAGRQPSIADEMREAAARRPGWRDERP